MPDRRTQYAATDVRFPTDVRVGKGLDDHLRDLADHLSSALWAIDPAGSPALCCSGAYETLWGRSLEELYADPDTSRPASSPT